MVEALHVDEAAELQRGGAAKLDQRPAHRSKRANVALVIIRLVDSWRASRVVHDIRQRQRARHLLVKMVERHVKTRFGGIRKRSEEHTSELQSLMRTSYAVFCLKKQKTK